MKLKDVTLKQSNLNKYKLKESKLIWVCFFYALEIETDLVLIWTENEKGELTFTFLPQIYHKLNLLMLW